MDMIEGRVLLYVYIYFFNMYVLLYHYNGGSHASDIIHDDGSLSRGITDHVLLCVMHLRCYDPVPV